MVVLVKKNHPELMNDRLSLFTQTCVKYRDGATLMRNAYNEVNFEILECMHIFNDSLDN